VPVQWHALTLMSSRGPLPCAPGACRPRRSQGTRSAAGDAAAVAAAAAAGPFAAPRAPVHQHVDGRGAQRCARRLGKAWRGLRERGQEGEGKGEGRGLFSLLRARQRARCCSCSAQVPARIVYNAAKRSCPTGLSRPTPADRRRRDETLTPAALPRPHARAIPGEVHQFSRPSNRPPNRPPG
jgi:hypothetical protein